MLMRLFVAVMLASGFTAQPAGPTKVVEEFRATVVSSHFQTLGLSTAPIHITLERWSTDAERQVLLAALRTGRPGALQDAIRSFKTSVGYLAPGGLSEPLGSDDYVSRDQLAYAVERRQATGARRITIISRSSWSVYWIELVIQADGSGDGFVDRVAHAGVNRDGTDIELKAAGPRMALLRIRRE
jgi:hypothetical protein